MLRNSQPALLIIENILFFTYTIFFYTKECTLLGFVFALCMHIFMTVSILFLKYNPDNKSLMQITVVNFLGQVSE